MLYIGIVEDRQDPKEMGRVKVRMIGLHSENKNEIPTESLPWAQVMVPNTGPAMTGIGETPYLLPGSWVVLMFTDETQQDPIIIGTLPSWPTEKRPAELGFSDPAGVYPSDSRLDEPDLHRRSRGKDYNEPYAGDGGPLSPPEAGWDPYSTKYPYNNIRGFEAGHYKEYDNTPDGERIKEFHKAGTFYEVHPNGDKVEHVVGSSYRVIMEDDKVHIKGNVEVHIDGDAVVTVTGNNTTNVLEGNSSLNVIKGNLTANILEGNVTTTIAKGDATLSVDLGNVTTNVALGNFTANIDLGATVIKSPIGGITLDGTAGGITILGPVTTDDVVTTGGLITSGGDVVSAKGISLDGHKHISAAPGSSSSAPKLPS